MIFALMCKDKPDMLALRQATRPDHLAYVKGAVLYGGPLVADDGETMIGSLIIIEAEDRAAAEHWAANDPYARAGLFKSVEITGFIPVAD